MKLKFWRKDNEEKDETTIKVVKTHHGTEISVIAQTSDKALSLYKKLDKELKK
jgi:hypothetical protein